MHLIHNVFTFFLHAKSSTFIHSGVIGLRVGSNILEGSKMRKEKRGQISVKALNLKVSFFTVQKVVAGLDFGAKPNENWAYSLILWSFSLFKYALFSFPIFLISSIKKIKRRRRSFHDMERDFFHLKKLF